MNYRDVRKMATDEKKYTAWVSTVGGFHNAKGTKSPTKARERMAELRKAHGKSVLGFGIVTPKGDAQSLSKRRAKKK